MWKHNSLQRCLYWKFHCSMLPPIKEGSFAGECERWCVSEAYTSGKGKLRMPIHTIFEVGRPAAILNSHPHSTAPSKQANTDTILDDTWNSNFLGWFKCTNVVSQSATKKANISGKRKERKRWRCISQQERKRTKKPKSIPDYFKKVTSCDLRVRSAKAKTRKGQMLLLLHSASAFTLMKVVAMPWFVLWTFTLLQLSCTCFNVCCIDCAWAWKQINVVTNENLLWIC